MLKIILVAIPMVLLTGCFGGGGEGDALSESKKQLVDLSAEVRALEVKRTELRKEAATLKSKVPKSSKKKGGSDAADSDSQVKASEYLAFLESRLNEVNSQIEQWQEPVRKSFEGLPFKGLEVEGEGVIPLVTISGITDDNLEVLIDGNSRKIPWSNLSIKTRLMLVHEPTVFDEAIK